MSMFSGRICLSGGRVGCFAPWKETHEVKFEIPDAEVSEASIEAALLKATERLPHYPDLRETVVLEIKMTA